MNKLVVAAVIQIIGLVIIVSSLFMFLLASGGTFWLYPLLFGVFLAFSAFLYLGSKAWHPP